MTDTNKKHTTNYSELEDRILNIICAECEECPNRLSCPEHECPLFRIEQVITEGE